MSTIHTSIIDLIGNTPLLELRRYGARRELTATILAKLESHNPVGSVKDRIAWAIIQDAEDRGLLTPGGEIVDVTSGNTGIALSAIAAARGYRATFYAGDNISPDKLALLRGFGARVISVPNIFFTDPDALVLLRARAQEENPGAFFADQLSNPANPQFHYRTTGPEIWRDTDGAVDILVGGVGTGGTLSGAGRYLKEQKSSVQVLPQQLPDNLDQSLIDEYVALETADAFATSLALAREEGLLAGSSAGAIVHVATRLARREENAGKVIVAVVPDSAERYLSAGIFDPQDPATAERDAALVGSTTE